MTTKQFMRWLHKKPHRIFKVTHYVAGTTTCEIIEGFDLLRAGFIVYGLYESVTLRGCRVEDITDECFINTEIDF